MPTYQTRGQIKLPAEGEFLYHFSGFICLTAQNNGNIEQLVWYLLEALILKPGLSYLLPSLAANNSYDHLRESMQYSILDSYNATDMRWHC